MADRTASVALELKASQFKAEASTVEGKVRSVDRAVDELDRDITKIPADAAKAGAALRLLSGDVKNVGTNFQAVGDKSTAMSVLDARIKSTRAEVKKLGDEFTRTGDIDVFKRLGRASGDLNALTTLRKTLSNAVEGGLNDGVTKGGPRAASTFASFFQGGLIEAFSSLPPELKAAVAEALVVSIVAASAPIGAAINGVLLAGIGLGGIGLGIAGQISNPAVKAAYAKLGQNLKAQLTSATGSFAQPLVNSARIFDTALSGVLTRLQPRFESLSHLLEPLARGFAGLVSSASPGFVDALVAAEPIIKELAAKLPGLGDSLSRFFALMADGSAGAKDGLDLLFLTIETLVVGIGGLIDGLSHLYHWFLAPGKEIMSWWDQLRGNTDGAARSLGGATAAAGEFGMVAEQGIGSLEDLNNELHRTAVTVDTVWSGMVDKALNQMLGLDRASLGWEQSLTRLSESVKQNGRSLDIHTAKGQANRSAILDGVAANQRLYDAEVASGTSAEVAGKHFQANEDALRAAAIAAGFNTGEVDKMIKKYGKVPPEIQTQIEMHGLTEAVANLDETLRLINHMPPRKSVNIDVNVHGNLFAASSAISNVLGSGYVSSGLGKKKRAGGGPVQKGLTYLVGEQGPEMFTAPANGQIMTAAKTSTMLSQNNYGHRVSPNGGRGGATTLEHTIKVVDGSSGRSGLATLVARMARDGDLQISSRAIVN